MPVEPKSPIDPSPTSCRFLGRCPHGSMACEQSLPELQPTTFGLHHRAACHRLEHLPEF
jgi:ABC-type dipeptide/oligopeptide/nickel transport system ATPase component